jgi:hypothetical protein
MNVSTTMAKPPTVRDTHVVSSAAQVTQKLERIDLERNLVVFRLTHEVALHDPVPVSLTSRYAANSIEGFARPSAINAFIAGRVPGIETVKGLVLVRPGFAGLAQKLGYMPAHEEVQNDGGAFVTRLFDRLRTGESSLDDIVFDDYGSHMLFDRHRKVLPVALHFSYLQGGTDNSAFDLQQMLKLLVANPQVRCVSESGEAKGLRIADIPYYNRDPERSKHIAFIFSPTREQMESMWEWAMKSSRKYPSTRLHHAVHALDLLGLKAGGACRSPEKDE